MTKLPICSVCRDIKSFLNKLPIPGEKCYFFNMFVFATPQQGYLKFSRTLNNVQHLHRGASDHSQDFEDKNLGSSPGLLGQ